MSILTTGSDAYLSPVPSGFISGLWISSWVSDFGDLPASKGGLRGESALVSLSALELCLKIKGVSPGTPSQSRWLFKTWLPEPLSLGLLLPRKMLVFTLDAFRFRRARVVPVWPSSTTCSSRSRGFPSTGCCSQVGLSGRWPPKNSCYTEDTRTFLRTPVFLSIQ